MKSRNRTRAHRERGTALIEFALVLPFMLVLTMLVIDFTRAFHVKNMLHQAAREGVRLAAVTTTAQDADVISRAIAVATRSGVTATATVAPPDEFGMTTVTCEAEFTWLYSGLLSFIGVDFVNPMTLVASQSMREET
jgi:Flp pilus assembly protein TadG